MKNAKNLSTGLCMFLSIIVCSLILLKPLNAVASDASGISAVGADTVEQEVVTISEEDVPLTGGIPQAEINMWWFFAVIGIGMAGAAIVCRFRAKKLIDDNSLEQTIF